MKFGRWLKKKDYRDSIILNIYFALGSILVIALFLIYNNFLVKDLRKEVKIVPDLYSKFIGLPSDVDLESFLFQYFMSEIFPKIEYPIILADSLNLPFSWENIEVEKKSFYQLDPKDQKYLSKKINKYRARGSVIPLKYKIDSDQIMGYVYFGESASMVRLRIMPYVEFGVVAVFIFFGIFVLLRLKKVERNKIWVGLAKETAHQLGTPLTSIIGWKDLLELKLEKVDNSEDIQNILAEMEIDIERLRKIGSRFGKVGSVLKNHPSNLHSLILETIEYFRLRIPSQSKKIEIFFNSKIQNKMINLDPDLIKWTLENLMKNSIDAMQEKGGKIIVEAFAFDKMIIITFKDTGKGIHKSMWKQIFKPGITSKERGWGLGLSLARRIIQEYHKGTIKVLDSNLDVGTTIQITIPEV